CAGVKLIASLARWQVAQLRPFEPRLRKNGLSSSIGPATLKVPMTPVGSAARVSPLGSEAARAAPVRMIVLAAATAVSRRVMDVYVFIAALLPRVSRWTFVVGCPCTAAARLRAPGRQKRCRKRWDAS